MGKVDVKWLGHAAFIVDYEDKVRIVIDPFLVVSPVKADEIDGVDLLLVTHAHQDHVGDSCEILKKNPKAKIVAIYELASHISEKCGHSEFIGMNIGGTWRYVKDGAEVLITQVEATHSSMGIGAATGFVIRFPNFSIYHAGDTGVFPGMELIGRLYKVKLALLPIGSHFTMGIPEAVEAVKMIKPETVIPMHYNTFDLIKADPEEFKNAVENATSTKVVILQPGESKTFFI